MRNAGIVVAVALVVATAFGLGRWTAGGVPPDPSTSSQGPAPVASAPVAEAPDHTSPPAPSREPARASLERESLLALLAQLQRTRSAEPVPGPALPAVADADDPVLPDPMDWPEAPDMRVLRMAWELVEQGTAQLDAGDLDGAERAFRAALELVPDDPVARAGLRRVADARDR